MINKKGQMEGLIGTIFAIVIIAGAILLFMGFDKVEANHMGVKVRLGEITGTMNPGIQWTGILTSTKQYDMRIRQIKVDMVGEKIVGSGMSEKIIDTGSATDNTGQAIFGAVSVNYKLKREADVVKGLWSDVGTDSVIARTLNIEPIIKEGFKQATVTYEAIEILQNRQLVKELAIENIRNNFPTDYFDIVDIVVEDIDFTKNYSEAIEAKKVATQVKLEEEIKVETAKFIQAQKIEEYKADAEKLRLQKEEITPLLIQKQMLEQWDGHLPQYLIMTPDSQGMLLNLAKGDLDTKPATPTTNVVVVTDGSAKVI